MLIDWFTVGAQVVNFLILVLLLKKFLYGPITGAIAAREARIQAQISEAEARRQEAAAAEAAIKKRLQELEDNRETLSVSLEAEAAESKKNLIEAARQEVEESRHGWLQSLSREKAALGQTVQERCSQQAFALARTILRELSDISLEEQFLKVFSERLAQLPSEDETAFRESLDESGGDALVLSAFPLNEGNRSQLLAALQSKFDNKIKLRFETDPGLIAGIEIKTRSRKLAWAVEGSLHNIEEKVILDLIPLPREH